ncbi:MAG: TIGR02594 family protein [Chloroflexi bacterium]|nr:TIGR02594 family protein [Chloroflexota bacterium]
MGKSIVTAYALRVREGPGTSYKVLGALYKDDVVDVLGDSPDGSWKNIRTAAGLSGWSSGKYLRDLSGEETPPEPAAGQYRVTAYALYVREGPGTRYKALGYLSRDDVVVAISSSADGNWKQVRRADGLSGWCSGKYLFGLDDTVPPPEPTTGHYRVTAYALYVREGPGTGYKAIGYLREGNVVAALGSSPDGNWKQVRLNSGLVGWCSSKYLFSLGPDKPPFEPDPTTGQFRVTAQALHLRAGPATNHESIGLLKQDEIVAAVDSSADKSWYQVRTENGLVGWCAGEYLYCLGGIESDARDNASATGFHRCITNTLKLYAGPDAATTVLAQLTQEETVNVLEISADGKWKKSVTVRGLIGWCEPKYLVSLGETATLREDEEFPWMPIAFNDLGLREFPGAPNNPRILEYMASTNLREYPFLPDETEWCAAFVNWCVEQAGIEPTGWATVYPWMAWGEEIKTPRRGCVVTFEWDDGGQHVAFYLGECGDRVRALGGNQSNAVWIKSYPKRNVVNYRIPKGWG